MRKCRGASNKAALIFFQRVQNRSTDLVERPWASRLKAESRSELTALAQAQVEYARFLFSVPKRLGPEQGAPNRVREVRPLAASAMAKSSRTKHPRMQISVKWERADCRFHEPATESGRFRALSHSAGALSLKVRSATRSEPSLFLVGRVRPLRFEKIDQKSQTCHYSILQPTKMRLASCQKIVSTGACDGSQNELANWRRLGQNDPRINIRGITFASGDVRLIDEQF